MTEADLWRCMLIGTVKGAIATLVRPISMFDSNSTDYEVPAHTQVKVVIATQAGELGITDNLLEKTDRCKVQAVAGRVDYVSLLAEGALANIKPL